MRSLLKLDGKTLMIAIVAIVFIASKLFFNLGSKGKCREGGYERNHAAFVNGPVAWRKLEGECFFATDYWEANERFLADAQAAGAETFVMNVTEEHATGVAIFHGNPELYYLHISGVHGAEGFAGSAVQLAILQYLAGNGIYTHINDSSWTNNSSETPRSEEPHGAAISGTPIGADEEQAVAVVGNNGEAVASTEMAAIGAKKDMDSDIDASIDSHTCADGSTSDNRKSALATAAANTKLPTLIFVHALNPYGFANNRRYNEDNIDLNRNFLSDEMFEFVKARDPNYVGYEDIDRIMNPTSKPFSSIFMNDIYFYLTLVDSVVNIGLSTMKKVLVSGNYHKQSGVGFGGFQHAKSTENLIELVTSRLKIPEKATRVALVDVHTGLGKPGVDTLMSSAFRTESQPSEAEAQKSPELALSRYAHLLFPTERSKKTRKLIGGLKEGSLQQNNHSLLQQQKDTASAGSERDIDGTSSSSPSTVSIEEEQQVEKVEKLEKVHKQTRKRRRRIVSGGGSFLSSVWKKIKQLIMPGKVSDGYELTVGTVSEGLCVDYLAPHLSPADRICLTQEFGTVSSIFVGQALFEENYAHHHGTQEEKEHYGEFIKDAFYVQKTKWKRSVVKRGLKVFLQAMGHFSVELV